MNVIARCFWPRSTLPHSCPSLVSHCTSASPCHEDGVCDPFSGDCINQLLPEDAPCDDGVCLVHVCCSLFAPPPKKNNNNNNQTVLMNVTNATALCAVCAGDPNTVDETCVSGMCIGIDLCEGVECPASSQCHVDGECVAGTCVPGFIPAVSLTVCFAAQ